MMQSKDEPNDLPGGTPTAKATIEADACEFQAAAPLEPCTIVIFGASGDLTARKLLPALFNTEI